ncbi:hypothetical protein O6H91_07G109900 [Diphasiastrum complanatum]|uniref:Uncharacterized protein n=2 Tax=Diphasiastrum complanatum TaxID=34168 RepID=A0ACC2D8S2_DIPCM|nr:hypothetical protein O6H91_07G109600 [Diphasiastrum complanatum]KAJ7550623.1 hypothetical protein O6H91_07G109900 [Diphasiastrum complanatum]
MTEGALDVGAAGGGSHEDCKAIRKPVQKAATGGQKACIFLFGFIVVERMVFYSIAGNLVTYLTTVLHLDIASSSKLVTYWFGVTNVCCLIGAFVADAYLGREKTIRSCIPVYLTVCFSSLQHP